MSGTLRGNSPELYQSIYTRLGHLISNMPALGEDDMDADGRFPRATLEWLAEVQALVSSAGEVQLSVQLDHTIKEIRTQFRGDEQAVDTLYLLLRRALYAVELRAPVAARGAFIPVGNAFDAMAAVGKVLQAATQDVLIVDPYLDEKVLTDFAGQATDTVSIRLLADQRSHKPTLKPAVSRWTTQYPTSRPVEARLTAPGKLHDRLILVDGADVWVLTQSLKDLAVRSPASLMRADPEIAKLKVVAYEDIWSNATAI